MSKNGAQQPARADHQAAWELLPWYVNGTLEGEDLEEVERHTANCVTCRAELKYLRELTGLLHASEDLPLSPDTGMAAVLARIQESEGEMVPSSEGRSARRWSWLDPLRQTPPRIRAFLVAEAAAILLLAGILALPSGEQAPPEYRALSDAVEVGPDSRTRVQVVFAPETTERQIRELLSSIEGEIVNGPTPLGVYSIATSISETTGHSDQALLEVLRARPEVTFAELAAQ